MVILARLFTKVKPGKRDLWANMPMLWCLQSYYEYSKDARVDHFYAQIFSMGTNHSR